MGGRTNQPQIYREHDKPYYRTGNKVLIALAAWSLVMFIIAKYYYVWRNKYVFAPPCGCYQLLTIFEQEKHCHLGQHDERRKRALCCREQGPW